MDSPEVSVIIPTYNAGEGFARLLASLRAQSVSAEVVVVDSSSADNTAALAWQHGAKVRTVPKELFDHGGTRTLAASLASGSYLVYLTQDALPCDNDTLRSLLYPFSEKKVGAVYGRQLPCPEASPFGAHLRLFNYSGTSHRRELRDRVRFGIKTPFLSNAFAAYRRSALEEIGWFKDRLICSEDTYAGAKLLKAGYRIAYAANACVYHSHNYTALQEMKRYFDIGVFHSSEDWILKEFGGAGGEGMAYVKSAVRYFRKTHELPLLPELFCRVGLKLIGYSLGRSFRMLPSGVRKNMSMHRDWWNKK